MAPHPLASVITATGKDTPRQPVMLRSMELTALTNGFLKEPRLHRILHLQRIPRKDKDPEPGIIPQGKPKSLEPALGQRIRMFISPRISPIIGQGY